MLALVSLAPHLCAVDSVAQLIGSHAILFLVVATLLTWGLAAGIWWAVRRVGPPAWRLASDGWVRASRSPLWNRARELPLLRVLLSRSLDAWRYLGLHAVVGFALTFAAMAAFFGIANEVRGGEELARFDEELIAALRAEISHATLSTFATITRFGDRQVLTAVVVLCAAVLAFRRRWLTLCLWLLATGGGACLVLLLKATFARTRPFHDHGFAAASGWSFPSGHTSGATLVYGMLGYLLVRVTPRAWHVPIAVAASALVVFIGFSRLILQVHYLTDVLAGYLAAVAWLTLCVSAFAVLRRGTA